MATQGYLLTIGGGKVPGVTQVQGVLQSLDLTINTSTAAFTVPIGYKFIMTNVYFESVSCIGFVATPVISLGSFSGGYQDWADGVTLWPTQPADGQLYFMSESLGAANAGNHFAIPEGNQVGIAVSVPANAAAMTANIYFVGYLIKN